MTHVGFTGTRNGMTDEQKKTVRILFINYSPMTLRHGDCVGADTDAHLIAIEIKANIIIHPPLCVDLRAFNKSNTIKLPRSYFERNRCIVDASDLLIATPETFEETKGGTWYTINYAKKKKKTVIIVYPDGKAI